MLQGRYEDLFSPSGDHCWVWADFLLESILGHNLDPFTKPITKNRIANYPVLKKSSKKYLNKNMPDTTYKNVLKHTSINTHQTINKPEKSQPT